MYKYMKLFFTSLICTSIRLTKIDFHWSIYEICTLIANENLLMSIYWLSLRA